MSAKTLIAEFNYRLDEFGHDSTIAWFEQLPEKDKDTIAKAMWVSQWHSSVQAVALQCSSLTRGVDALANTLAGLNHNGLLNKGCCEILVILGMLVADLEGYIALMEKQVGGKVKVQDFLGPKSPDKHQHNRAVAAKYLGRERLVHLLSGAALAEVVANMEAAEEEGDGEQA